MTVQCRGIARNCTSTNGSTQGPTFKHNKKGLNMLFSKKVGDICFFSSALLTRNLVDCPPRKVSQCMKGFTFVLLLFDLVFIELEVYKTLLKVG